MFVLVLWPDMYWDPNGIVNEAFGLPVCGNNNGDPKVLADEAAHKQ